jgi:hypothetical protein
VGGICGGKGGMEKTISETKAFPKVKGRLTN